MNARMLIVLGTVVVSMMVEAADLAEIPIPKEPGFNLTFKGGTPKELVQEMKEAVARTFREPDLAFPINVVVPKESQSKL